VSEDGSTDRPLLDIGVGDLEGHTDREGDIGEVEEVGWGVVLEVDAARRVREVEARVAE